MNVIMEGRLLEGIIIVAVCVQRDSMERIASLGIDVLQGVINKCAKMEALLLDSGGTVNAYALATRSETIAKPIQPLAPQVTTTNPA